MKELFEFRIFKDNYHLLSQPNRAVFNGAIWVLKITEEDPLFQEIGRLNEHFKKKLNDLFYGIGFCSRSYTKRELDSADLLHLFTKKQFQPVGEECGTIYNDSVACEICGAYPEQTGPLVLKRKSIPKSDVASTIAGEMVFSEKFVDLFKKRNFKGANFEPVFFEDGRSDFYQMKFLTPAFSVAKPTKVGLDVFNDMPDYEDRSWFDQLGREITERVQFKCPKGHLLGGNLISELYVDRCIDIFDLDIATTKQLAGTRMGVIRPSEIFLCSQSLRRMVVDEKLLGFSFDVAHIK
ncbi:hypothetical protein CPT03_01595 [Pedobacter ginsengisoli]|uniref:Uncharacterized protein n=1 Tax=Pedobacter ginsengisoli TaxID=363852 RepID=A0A2D1U0Y0_9SPHI|nr:hypothetical protein [Pedobacter ginsengisoli]ATP55246.1 hypothetical protein CPT03_01595 [Pedobacter ginsengisoli]